MAGLRRRPNGRWEVRYFAEGRRHSKVLADRDEAERFARSVEVAKDRGEWRDPQLGRTPFSVLARDWAGDMVGRPDLAGKTKLGYLDALEHRLLPWWADKAVSAATPSTVRSWVRWAASRYKPSTVSGDYRVLRLVFADAVERRMIIVSPCVKPGLPPLTKKDIQPVTPEEAQQLAGSIERHALAVELGAICGLRAGEVWGLTVGALDMLRGRLVVRWHLVDHAGHVVMEPYGKGRKRRVVPLPSALGEAIAAHLLVLPVEKRTVEIPTRQDDGSLAIETHELVLPGVRRRAVRHHSWYRDHFKPAATAAGLPDLEFHDLRHSAVAMWLDNDIRIEVVSEWLGHSSTAFTQRTYEHLLDSTHDRAEAALDAAVRKVRRAPVGDRWGTATRSGSAG